MKRLCHLLKCYQLVHNTTKTTLIGTSPSSHVYIVAGCKAEGRVLHAGVNCVCNVCGSVHSCGWVVNGSFAMGALFYYWAFVSEIHFEIQAKRFFPLYCPPKNLNRNDRVLKADITIDCDHLVFSPILESGPQNMLENM